MRRPKEIWLLHLPTVLLTSAVLLIYVSFTPVMDIISDAGTQITRPANEYEQSRGVKSSVSQCSKLDHQHCVKLADPLLKDPRLVYPDNLSDIDLVCQTWTRFVDCVKRYTEQCFTDTRRKEFNKAVESPVDSIHKLCTMKSYQEEYLKHAPCMKATLTEDSHCGRHYRHLVAQVSEETSRTSICCSHHRFRECVLDQTRSTCSPEAGPFSRQILDKALSFLKEQCANYVPNSADCPGADFYTPTRQENSATPHYTGMEMTRYNTRPTFDSTMGRTTDFESEPTWMSDAATNTRAGSTRNIDFTNSPPSSWMPGQGRSTDQQAPTMTVTSETMTDTTNTRTSFARGMSWMPSSPSTTTPTTTSTTWKMTSGYHSETTWFPSKPSSEQINLGNAIDEPNQQGLGSRNSATFVSVNTPLTILALGLWLIGR